MSGCVKGRLLEMEMAVRRDLQSAAGSDLRMERQLGVHSVMASGHAMA